MNAAITNEVQQGVLTFNDCLTLSFFAAILCLPCNRSYKHGIGVPQYSTAIAAIKAVFYCVKYRSKFIMLGWEEGRKTASSLTCTPIPLSLTPELAFLLSGLSPFNGVYAMLQNNSAPNAQSPIVLNPKTLANAMQLLERAQNHAGNLSLQYDNHSIAPDLTMLECEIAQAYDMLSRVIMSGVKKSPLPAKTSPEEQTTTQPQRQTRHGLEQDGAGYDCRVLLDDDGQYNVVDPTCTPPAGYRQVCIKCGHDRFMSGVTYGHCPQCRSRVVYHCRYVAIAGGK